MAGEGKCDAEKAPRVALIDYGSSNLGSVEKALEQAGAKVVRCLTPEAMDSCDAVVLPGVGSFGDCARRMKERGLTEALKEWLLADRTYLGICLGYQILFEGSEESPDQAGLGHWSGQVVKFPRHTGLKVPHMGWNQLGWKKADQIFADLPDPAHLYFVHSYFPLPNDPRIVTATSNHGLEFAAAAGQGRVRGMQFHPEKSQKIGLQILKNFVKELKGKN